MALLVEEVPSEASVGDLHELISQFSPVRRVLLAFPEGGALGTALVLLEGHPDLPSLAELLDCHPCPGGLLTVSVCEDAPRWLASSGTGQLLQQLATSSGGGGGIAAARRPSSSLQHAPPALPPAAAAAGGQGDGAAAWEEEERQLQLRQLRMQQHQLQMQQQANAADAAHSPQRGARGVVHATPWDVLAGGSGSDASGSSGEEEEEGEGEEEAGNYAQEGEEEEEEEEEGWQEGQGGGWQGVQEASWSLPPPSAGPRGGAAASPGSSGGYGGGGAAQQAGGTRIIVRNMVQSVPPYQVKSFFKRFGKVEEVIKFPEVCYAFVHFSEAAAAAAAVEQLDCQLVPELNPREPVNVQYRTDVAGGSSGGGGRGGRGGGGAGPAPPSKTLFVGHITPRATKDTLLRVFGRFGPVSVLALQTAKNRGGEQWAAVRFRRQEDAVRATVALQGTALPELTGHDVIKLAYRPDT